jgi:nucleoside-diphosphate-sugar epimerase
MDDTPGRFVPADLLDGGAMASLVAGCDAVVHTGNHKCVREDMPPAQTYLENVTMNTHVFQAAQEAGVNCVVFASSIQVISGSRLAINPEGDSCLRRLPLDHQSPQCPGNTYALSKLAGEQMLRYLASKHPGRSYTSLRFPWLIAECFKPSGPAKPGRTTHADEAFAYLGMADAADLILAALNKSLPGYHQYLPSAGNSLGLSPAETIKRYYPKVPLAAPVQSLDSLVDITVIHADLGWTPREVDLFALHPDPA